MRLLDKIAAEQSFNFSLLITTNTSLKRLGVSRQQAARIALDLIEDGFLQEVGKGSARHYVPIKA